MDFIVCDAAVKVISMSRSACVLSIGGLARLLVTRDACGRPVSCQVELGWLPFLVRNGIFNVREAHQFKNGYDTICWKTDWSG